MKYVFIVLLMVSSLGIADTYQAGVKAYNQQNYREAYNIWWPIAQKGNAIAQYNIGVIYENGYGIKKNIKQAFKWYKLSAESGYDKIQYALGNAYYFGKGVKQDYDQAIYWWKLAATQNVVSAQYNLGIMHIYGDDKYRNVEKAKFWLKRASKNGHKASSKILAKLSQTFDETNPKSVDKKSKFQIAKKPITAKVSVATPSNQQAIVKKPFKAVLSKPKKNYIKPPRSNKAKPKANKSKSLALVKKVKKSKKIDWISKQPLKNYSLQLTVQPSKKHAIKFINHYRLNPKANYYKVGSFYKIIYGSYRNEKSARLALRKLPWVIKKDKPWPKNFKAIRKERGF